MKKYFFIAVVAFAAVTVFIGNSADDALDQTRAINDKKEACLKKLVNKEMIIVDESAPNEIRVYKNMNDVVIDKTNERAIFYKLKTNDTCIIEVVGDQTFWFHTIPNITRVFECRKDK